MADGFSLNIDTKFMQDLEKAEQKIQGIATASEKTRDIVIDSFSKMRTQGLDPFMQAAKTFQQEMRGMRVVNLGLGVVTREAAAATDSKNGQHPDSGREAAADGGWLPDRFLLRVLPFRLVWRENARHLGKKGFLLP